MVASTLQLTTDVEGCGSQVLEDMQAAGIEPDIVTHELLVRAHIALLDVPGMMAALDNMQQASFEPPMNLLEACIARGEREGRLDAVEQIEGLPALRRLRTIGNIPKVGPSEDQECHAIVRPHMCVTLAFCPLRPCSKGGGESFH